MHASIRTIRRSVAGGGVLLAAALLILLWVAHLRGHRFHLDLPGRLGVDVSQTANGFTYSQSQKGHTLFTIHASKLVEYKADEARLHDVTITLYGTEGSGRTDKIYGTDFVYDRKQGVARATGAVQIDFASPAVKAGDPAASSAGSTIHVTTTALLFNQSTGEASTDQRVDFALTRAKGSAVGAHYNSNTGILVLDKDVALTTEAAPGGTRGTDAVIHAAHAQLLRAAHQAFLLQAESTYGGEHTTSDQATVNFRTDGSAEHVDARGHVHLTTADGAEVHSSSALIDLNEQSQPEVADLGGGVTYHAASAEQTMQGSAVSGTLRFAAAPGSGKAGAGNGAGARQQQLRHAQFRDAVSFLVQQHSLAGDPNGSATREMAATTVDIDFAPGPDGQAEAQHALGVGGASVKLHDIPAKGPGKVTTISGDQLLATLAGGRVLEVLDGKGNTRVVDNAPDGAVNTSTGDLLHVTFAGGPGARAAARQPRQATAPRSGIPGSGSSEVEDAVQTGNVVLLQTPAPGAKTADGTPQAPMRATAARAEFGNRDQVLHLTGDPHLRNDTVALTADKVDYYRDTGDAVAMGEVKATYVQQPGQKGSGPTLGGDGPTHVVADHGQMTRANNLSIFYGVPGSPARMWQGGDQVTAPVLELARDGQTLDAHGVPGERSPVVHATLGAKEGASGGRTPGEQAAKGAQPAAVGRAGAPTRLTSVTLHYADKDRRADLHGAVVAEQPTGVVHADEAQVFLTPAVPGKPSSLDHMVATGSVIITQPGRRGTGTRLVYTAGDGRYTLTGTHDQPPRVTDAEKGTSTGAALIFKGADDSVQIANQAADAAPGPTTRTVTDTRSPK